MPLFPASFRITVALAGVLLAGLSLSATAQLSEDSAKQAAQELKVLVTEGTAVIGGLQPAINSGKVVPEQVAPDALVEQFKARYQKAAGVPLDVKAKGVVGDARRAYLQAFTTVVTRFQGVLAKGGQDAFVPAFFRAQTLRVFNELMQGRIQGYATNRENEVINSDWAVQKVMKGSPLAPEVERLMATGGLEPVVKRSGNTVMGYYPMKLAPACVACHAQNGLKQTVGTFGGALVAEIPVK